MPVKIDGQPFYTMLETCEKVGISRATLSRWIKGGLLQTLYKDRRGWRIFTEDDLNQLQAEVSRIEVEERP